MRVACSKVTVAIRSSSSSQRPDVLVGCVRATCFVGDEDLGNRFVEDGEGGWFEAAVADDVVASPSGAIV